MSEPAGVAGVLEGRVALVTGASSGFGAHFGKLLAAAGAKVVLGARRADRLAALADEIAAAGGEALAVSMDVTSESSIVEAYDAAQSAFGAVDTIIANAGVNHPGIAIDQLVEDFDDIMRVNLRGVFLTVREGARRLVDAGSREREHGRVVIVSSITADIVEPGLSFYSASKAGVVQLGKVLAKEWVRKGINVNMLCPGYAPSEIAEDWFETESGKRQIAGFHRRRLMSVDGLDGPLLLLCSDASKAITGALLTVDDGQSL
jgi:NAD(P)-dependent dehydrogenase (short-subunit alcohol dehydrogenase family)